MLFYAWENRGSVRLNNLPTIWQLIEVGILTLIILLDFAWALTSQTKNF